MLGGGECADTAASSSGLLCCSSYWSSVTALSEVDAFRLPPPLSLVTEAFLLASLPPSPLPLSESPLLWLYLSESFLLASSSGWL